MKREGRKGESRNSGELYLLYLIKNRESVWYGKVYFSLTSQCVYRLFLPFFFPNGNFVSQLFS